MASTPTPLRKLDRLDLLAVVLAFALVVLMVFRARSVPSLVGFSEDDGTYLCTAKSLAEGHGYRHLNLPGEPLQTKYPPLYPALLAIIWWMQPEFPRNVFLIQAAQAVGSGIVLWLAYRLARCDWQMPAPLALCGVAAALSNPHWWTHTQIPMSETTYAAATVAALAAAAYGAALKRRNAGTAAQLGVAALAGLLAAAAYLSRSIGVTAVATIAATYLLRRRWHELLVAGVTMLVPSLLWSLWRAAASAENQRTGLASIFVYDLDYGAWLPDNLATWVWVAYLNAARVVAGTSMQITLISDRHLAVGLLGAASMVAIIWVSFVVPVALMLLGLGRTLAGPPRWVRGAPLYILLYWGLMLAWPGDPESAARLQTPLLPLIVPAMLLGLHVAVTWTSAALCRIRRRLDRAAPLPALSQRARRATRVAVVFGMTLICWNIHIGRAAAAAMVREPRRVALEELAVHLRDRTPADAVVAAHCAGYLHLRTGRKVIMPAPVPELIPSAYPSDARFFTAGTLTTVGQRRAFGAMIARELLRYYERAGVTYVVLGGREGGAEFVNEFVRARPERFQKLDAVGIYEVYRVLGLADTP